MLHKEPDGSYKIPRIIYADAYASEMMAYADLVLPDTTYLERWDCISLLDRPIGSAEGPGDAIRQPVLKPDHDVRPFQDVLIDLGARLKLPGLTNADGSPRYPGGYPDYIVNHERKPGIGPLGGWRGPSGDQQGAGPVNLKQLDRYIANGCFWRHHLPEDQLYYKHANKGYLETAQRMGFVDKVEQIVLHLYCEPLQKFRLAAQGDGAIQPPEQHRKRVETYFDPLPIWYTPFEESQVSHADFPMHAMTQRPMQMYHAWHSQNAWLRQITGENRLYIHRGTATAIGLFGRGKVSSLDRPHTNQNYLLREMGFAIARKHAQKLRRIALILGFAAPLVLTLLAALAGGPIGKLASVVAVLSVMAGMLAERWLFFAEARHTVTLYYGASAA